MAKLVSLSEIEPEAVEALLDAAFGTDRHGRTAYRIREGIAALPDLSFAAMDHDALFGTIQCWPVALTPEGDVPLPLAMVGPVAVLPEEQGKGIGQLMTHAVCAQLDARDLSAMMIGDPEYYERFFGFVSGPASQWTLPGPVKPHRILLRAAPGSTWPERGILGADLLRSPA